MPLDSFRPILLAISTRRKSLNSKVRTAKKGGALALTCVAVPRYARQSEIANSKLLNRVRPPLMYALTTSATWLRSARFSGPPLLGLGLTESGQLLQRPQSGPVDFRMCQVFGQSEQLSEVLSALSLPDADGLP